MLSSLINKYVDKVSKAADSAQESLKDAFASLSERDWLRSGNEEFRNFWDDEHGILTELIHPLERERFAELKKNETLGLILTVIGNTHASLTSIAEIPDRSFIVSEKTCPRLYGLHRIAHDKL